MENQVLVDDRNFQQKPKTKKLKIRKFSKIRKIYKIKSAKFWRKNFLNVKEATAIIKNILKMVLKGYKLLYRVTYNL